MVVVVVVVAAEAMVRVADSEMEKIVLMASEIYNA